ncbi:MAG: MarR family transcriptional regulator [Actinomycetota bacterium]|nr:MarR family transcriptional regulator [Actinomycetota bacterium]
MSNIVEVAVDRETLRDEIAAELAELQAAYDDSDRALARRLGIGRTDLRCLDLIIRTGPRNAGQVAATLGLTRGSVTTLIDRLERAGYASRQPDPTHGKRVLVAPTPSLIERIIPLVEPRARAGQAQLADYTAEELTLIRTFLRDTRERHAGYARELRAYPDG